MRITITHVHQHAATLVIYEKRNYENRDYQGVFCERDRKERVYHSVCVGYNVVRLFAILD